MLQRRFQSLWVILEIRDVRSFSTKITLGTGVFLVAPHLNNLAAFGGDFEAAVVKTEHTGCLLPFAHDPPPLRDSLIC
jgi:hypothetical protein